MNIIIEAPAGPRTGVVPFDGIDDEAALIKSLILTLALERRIGTDDVTLTIDCAKVDANRLVAIAKMFSQLQIEQRFWDGRVH
jgi:hypothetical protein